MRLFSDIEYEAALQTYAFNTGTPVDLQNGRYEVGYDGGVYLNGGFGSQIIAIEAMNGRFKSTVAASLQANLMGLYDELEWLIYDTEDSISKDRERVRKMGEYGEIAPERIIWLDGVEYDLDGLLNSSILKFVYLKKRIKRILSSKLLLWMLLLVEDYKCGNPRSSLSIR